MPCNIGNTDKWIRIILGIAIILAGVLFQSWWGALGILPILIGAVRYCPLYTIIKLDTRSQKEKEGKNS